MAPIVITTGPSRKVSNTDLVCLPFFYFQVYQQSTDVSRAHTTNHRCLSNIPRSNLSCSHCLLLNYTTRTHKEHLYYQTTEADEVDLTMSQLFPATSAGCSSCWYTFSSFSLASIEIVWIWEYFMSGESFLPCLACTFSRCRFWRFINPAYLILISALSFSIEVNPTS